MSEKLLWEDSPDYRVWVIHEGEYMRFVTEYKVDALLDANKSKQVDFSKTSALGDIVQVASIPNAMYWEWYKQGIIQDDAAFARKLNDGDLAHIRTNNLKV